MNGSQVDSFELYYTKLPSASTMELDISEAAKVSFEIEDCYEDDDVAVFVRPVNPDEIEYVVARRDGDELEFLEDVVRKKLA
ncbi:MAG: hypothetical protein ATN35_00860 [Epulopiscium sp. Nele67-Bin004]|nr:MAG: hypothetical protein ATN35_00860 [Epulopiscium sp. Nele67-Bin004]